MLLTSHNLDRYALLVRQRTQISRSHARVRYKILERETLVFLVHPSLHYLGHWINCLNRLATLLFLNCIRWNQQLLEFQQYRSVGNLEHS